MAARNKAAEIDSTWLDKMVKNLTRELERQLEAVAKAKTKDDPAGRAADARTLSSLERTLERLAKLERERAGARERKVAAHEPEPRAALERRLDKRLAALGQKGAAAKPDTG